VRRRDFHLKQLHQFRAADWGLPPVHRPHRGDIPRRSTTSLCSRSWALTYRRCRYPRPAFPDLARRGRAWLLPVTVLLRRAPLSRRRHCPWTRGDADFRRSILVPALDPLRRRAG
jgi:hypothetical protein